MEIVVLDEVGIVVCTDEVLGKDTRRQAHTLKRKPDGGADGIGEDAEENQQRRGYGKIAEAPLALLQGAARCETPASFRQSFDRAPRIHHSSPLLATPANSAGQKTQSIEAPASSFDDGWIMARFG